MSDEPRRLLEGGEPFLQSLLEAGRSDLPDAARIEALAAKLGPALGGGGGAAVATKTTLVSSSVAKAVVAIVVAAGVATTFVVMRSSSVPVPVPVSSSPAPVAVVVPDSAPVQFAPISSSESVTAPAVPTPHASRPAPPDDPEEEARLLHRAQDELAASPARTLATCQEHARRFPRGLLAQEREVLAIDALVRLGRRGEATRRAETFSRAYPSSSHRRRIDALLAAP